MGHFKSVSKKKRIKRKIIIYLCFIVGIILLAKYASKKINISPKYLDYVTNNYLNMEFIKKENINIKPVFKEEKSPTVYIYNTHQTEKYKYDKIESYNIDYTVMFVSYMLESYLNDYDVTSFVETDSISTILKNNNLLYKDSYKASRILLEKRIIEMPTLKYFIDIHRDSSIYEKTTCNLNNKNYAKLLFVVGLEHENYIDNLLFANNINERIKEIDPCLTRGVLQKEGEGVDGKYNQDFNEKTILIEVGGQYNLIEEANNTIKVLASVLYEYIMEDAWNQIKRETYSLKYYLSFL